MAHTSYRDYSPPPAGSTSPIRAYGNLTGAGALVAGAGIAGAVRTAVGTYQITLAAPVPQATILATVEETAARDSIEVHYQQTSPTVIVFTIHEGDNGAGANTLRDRDFSLAVLG